MRCAESLHLQAYFDREVDAVSAADIERHMEHCAECRALLEDLERTRAALLRDVTHLRTPPALRAQISRALDRESVLDIPRGNWRGSTKWHPPPFWVGAASGVGVCATAAILAFFLLMPSLTNPLTDELLGAHLRSLMSSHLIDVVSTDKHTVKPWFAGHADVSPIVADFEPQGYRLIGGRTDYLDHQRAAAVVYQHGQHIINVFSWGTDQRNLSNDMTRSGYHFAFWKSGDLQYCAVSDTNWDELLGLVRLLRDLGARDDPESKN